MAFVVFTGPPKEYFLSFNPSRFTFSLSKDLREEVGMKIDIFIDKEKYLFGIKSGESIKVYGNNATAPMRKLAVFIGVKKKCRLPVKMSKKHGMFVGKCKMPFVDAWKRGII